METGYLPPGQDGGEAAEKGERKAHGVPLLCRTAHLGGQKQQPKRISSTTKLAYKSDIWLHTQKIHGSHVILWLEGGEADAQSLTEAAILGGHLLPGGRGKPGAGGLYAGKVIQEAGRRGRAWWSIRPTRPP